MGCACQGNTARTPLGYPHGIGLYTSSLATADTGVSSSGYSGGVSVVPGGMIMDKPAPPAFGCNRVSLAALQGVSAVLCAANGVTGWSK